MKAQSQVSLWKLTLRWSNADDCWRKLCWLLALEYWKVFLVLPDCRAAIHYIHLLLHRKKVLAHSMKDGHFWEVQNEKQTLAYPQLKSNSVPKVCLASSFLELTTHSIKNKNTYKWWLGSKIRPSKPVSTTI